MADHFRAGGKAPQESRVERRARNVAGGIDAVQGPRFGVDHRVGHASQTQQGHASQRVSIKLGSNLIGAPRPDLSPGLTCHAQSLREGEVTSSFDAEGTDDAG